MARHNEAIQLYLSEVSNQPVTKIKLSLSVRRLRGFNVFKHCNPIAVVYEKMNGEILKEIHRTEIKMNSCRPDWRRPVLWFYQEDFVEEPQLVFRIYDVNSGSVCCPVKNLNLSEQTFIGQATCLLSDVVSQLSRTLELQLKNEQHHRVIRGMLTIRMEETVATTQAVEMVFRCDKLQKGSLLSKRSPILRISRHKESGDIQIYETEAVMNNLTPIWKPVSLSTQDFLTKDTRLVIECLDRKSSGKDEIIGKIHASVEDLENLHSNGTGMHLWTSSTCTNQRKMLDETQLFVDSYTEQPCYSFSNYINNGFTLESIIAVDFTASNGNSDLPTSLHYIDPSLKLNAYEQALSEVGKVIEFFDKDKRFPAYGFGGLPNGTSDYCFNLNGSFGETEVEGVDGILTAYLHAQQNVIPAGPSRFGEVITAAAKHASLRPRHEYSVLVIVTDGVLDDIQETIDSIVNASLWPLSIIIVGVGNGDFGQMEILDADCGIPLKSGTGKEADRDIVQFVKFQKFQGQFFVKELLDEVHEQFLTYMQQNQINPLVPRDAQVLADNFQATAVGSTRSDAEEIQTEASNDPSRMRLPFLPHPTLAQRCGSKRTLVRSGRISADSARSFPILSNTNC